MIVTKLQGGHSNQLFQYAAGRSLALSLGVDLYMDRQWFGAIAEGDTPRFYELDSYRLEQRFIDPGDFTLTEERPKRSKLRSRLARRASPKPVLEHYRQKGHSFDANVLRLADDSYLEGWWQDERYFSRIRATLLDEIELRQPVAGQNAEWLRRIEDSVSVSLHVRRGDYVTNPVTRAFHGVLDASYYGAALGRLVELTGERTLELFVFSNDIDWCRRELQLGQRTSFVEGNSGPVDMHLMRRCRHHIVANSSFSWWGAWLSDHPGKVVIAPRTWFSDAAADAEIEIVPPSWVRL